MEFAVWVIEQAKDSLSLDSMDVLEEAEKLGLVEPHHEINWEWSGELEGQNDP